MALKYMSGFGGSFETEAATDALPVGRNSPQRARYGLFAEQISGTAFTAPRHENRRSWLYRLRPAAAHGRFDPCAAGSMLRSGPFDGATVSPNRLRWNPLPTPSTPTDFIDGLVTFGGNGDPSCLQGVALHLYAANLPMHRRIFCNADGEMLLTPQAGKLLLATEFGRLDVGPGEIAVIPRGVRFRVDLPEGEASGYVCENYGAMFRLPDLGAIGANGLANSRDFLTPVAWFEDVDEPTQIVQKFQGRLWSTTVPYSPLEVVAWHGNLAPYKYDLSRFNALNTVSYDHPDPSIFTVLTSPSEVAGSANCDFVVFPPRWMVAEDTFRPPWFHRNLMSEFMGLIHGAYDAKAEGFLPGGASLHNCMAAHGPDRVSYQRAVEVELAPQKLDQGLAFMFETRRVIRPTEFAATSPLLQADYDDCWSGFRKGTASVAS